MNKLSVDQAIILAAGKGERLGVLTTMRPKVMLPIGNKPIVEYVVEALVANGILDIILVVGYQRLLIQDYLGSGERFGVNLQYVIQDRQLGTGHALSAAENFAKQRFLVLPGDNIIDANAVRDLASTRGNAILVTDQARGEQYGVVGVQHGKALALVEKPQGQSYTWGNTGAYLLTDQIFEYLKQELQLPTAINHMMDDGVQVTACETTTGWLDAVYPWDLLKVNGLALAQIKGNHRGECEPGVTLIGEVRIDPGSMIRANSYIVGPAIIGEGCEIGPGAVVFPYTSLGKNVVIESFTQLRNCIISESVHIGSHSHLTDTFVGEASSIGPYFTATSADTAVSIGNDSTVVHTGSVISENVEIGAHVSLSPGTIVGPNARIRDNKSIQQDIPESAYVV